MMTMRGYGRYILSFFLAALTAGMITGCEQEGSAEKAGKQIDQAFDTVKEKVHEATE